MMDPKKITSIFAAALFLSLMISGCSEVSAPINDSAPSVEENIENSQENIPESSYEISLQNTQDRVLVWSDEFNGSSLDQSIWSFQLGQFNDCVHYSSDRQANTVVKDGTLRLIALEESYHGYDYTASVIKTKHSLSWRYGRIEARIKLPSSNGFVPAFWMLPENESLGWWPDSGEIDIMEHPTNEVNKIYGSIHTGDYNYFTGSEPRGGVIEIPDAESTFHLYAVEWTPEKIDFFVDDHKYYTFNNDNSGDQTWPFDQPFYITLNMAVGGAWVGDPDANTVFPAVMEIDYVRVYQYIKDFAIQGPDYVMLNSKSLTYSTPAVDGLEYHWRVPDSAEIISGQSTPNMVVDWGLTSGNIELVLAAGDESWQIEYPVEASNNLLQNAGFETGAKYWHNVRFYPAEAAFSISNEDVQSGAHSIFVEVKGPGINPWDVQLSQSDLVLESGLTYSATFWAKSETNSVITTAIINTLNHELYASETFDLTNTWTLYSFEFGVPFDVVGSFNIDMGGHTGKYKFDNFQIIKSGSGD
jgi:beta-glucanase (GH16 family)